MFYSNQILARKGPLGLVWIAAHLDRQLKRQQINNTSIPASVDTLLDPEVPLALRLSGQLLLGVVRIYARKVGYLQQDCNDALVKIRVALRPGDGVTLPPESQTAPVESITLVGPRAAAAAGARGRGRKAAGGAAAGAAAGAAGAAGIEGEDEFEFGLEDFYWEQEVLVGRDGGFGGLELGSGALELAPSMSGPLSQDISGVFGMPSTDDNQEMFDIEDEEAAALWDLDDIEVEKLRAAPSQSQSQALSGGGDGALAGLLGPVVTPGVEGPAGKAGPGPDSPAPSEAAAAAAADVEGDDQGEGVLTQHAVEGVTPKSTWGQPGGAAGGTGGTVGDEGFASSGGFGFSGEPLDAAAALPPTPATAGVDGTEGGSPDPVKDLQDLLPDTPHVESETADEVAAAAAGAADAATAPAEDAADEQQQQHEQEFAVDEYELMDVDGPPTAAAPEAEQTQEAAAAGQQQQEEQGDGAGGATPTKTFQRRTTRQQQRQQQQQENACASPSAAGTAAAAAAPADKKAAAAARQQKKSQLLGHKRRAVVDDYTGDRAAGGAGGAGAGGSRQPPTELPAAEIRSLLANRSPLMDRSRGQAVVDQFMATQTAAACTASLLLLPPAAPAAAVPAASAATAAGSGDSSRAVLAGLLAPPGGSTSSNNNSNTADAAAGAAGGAGNVTAMAAAKSTTAGLAFAAPLSVSFGGMPLPVELQELLAQAASNAAGAAAAAAAPAAGGGGGGGGGAAAALAPTAALDEIGIIDQEDEEAAGVAGYSGGLVAGAVTRQSLSLSLVSTPGSAAAGAAGGDAAGGLMRTPGTVEQPAAGAGVEGEAAGTAGPGTAGLSTGGSAGFDGYTPGSLGFGGGASQEAGLTPAATTAGETGQTGTADKDAGVLRDLDPAEVALTHQDMSNYDVMTEMAEELPVGDEEGSDKENPVMTRGLASAGKAAAVGGGGGSGAAAGFIGSSLRSTQEVMLPWPADAEHLMEAAAEDADGAEIPDGGFTSRTRLVMRCLQHAAATAAAGAVGGSGGSGSSAAATGAGGATPLTGSKRRISAMAPPASLSKDSQQQQQQSAVSLSFQGLIGGRSRLDACRWFYEVLVLENKGLVKLQQEEAYRDITVTPNLGAMARV